MSVKLVLCVLTFFVWTSKFECRSVDTHLRSQRIRDANLSDLAPEFARAVSAVDDQVLDLLGGLENFEFIRQVWDPHSAGHLGHENADHYTNEWLVHIPEGRGNETVTNTLIINPDDIANRTGYVNMGQVRGFPGVYRFVKVDHPSTHHRGARHLSQQLESIPEVFWADQQFSKSREKRQMVQNILDRINPLTNNIDSAEVTQQVRFNDPLWERQWYFQSPSAKRSVYQPELGILPAFAMGYTGRGVRVVVLDDGVEHSHPDLRDSYDPSISYDLNDETPDPTPRYGDTEKRNSHGTRCAGEIAMKPNNAICGVGVAPGVRLGGVRMLDGPISDLVEGRALSYALDQVDIYSSSWGPNDDGMTVEGPGRLARQAILQGIANGRDGKGIIYVWASGNGGENGDSCSCDGYTSNIFTLSIGSATQTNSFPWYGEPCSSTMAVTYSSGSAMDDKVATTDILGQCTTGHTGTSASAPLAAGIVALALEANPTLTWRDVKHLVAWTSQPEPLYRNSGWKMNGAGFLVNEKFGFGLMDAFSLVANARNWSLVPAMRICKASVVGVEDRAFTGDAPRRVTFTSDGCMGSENEIRRLEHVVLVASVRYSQRGALQIDLESPQGTSTRMLFPRHKDNSATGFESWPFVSVHNWGENPRGRWTVTLSDAHNDGSNVGLVQDMDLIFYGTLDDPQYLRGGRKQYNPPFPGLPRQSSWTQSPNKPVNNLHKVIRRLETQRWF